MNKLVSVIVPIYNVEKYLRRCIDSIINQTYRNIEVILIDDGSLDNCPKICDDYKKLDNRIKAIHKKNGGLSSARNNGIELSTGDYLLFVDSDDYLTNNAIETMLKKIGDSDLLIFGHKKLKFENIQNMNNYEGCFYSANYSDFDKLSSTYASIVAWNKLIKKAAIKQMFNEKFKVQEDIIFSSQFFNGSYNIRLIKDCLYVYEWKPNTLGKKKDGDYLDYLVKVKDAILLNLGCKFDDLKYVKTWFLKNIAVYLKPLNMKQRKKVLNQNKGFISNVKSGAKGDKLKEKIFIILAKLNMWSLICRMI